MPIKSITIDPEAKAVYLKIKDGIVKRTREFAQEVFLDLDSRNNLVGIELLNPSSIAIHRVARKYHLAILGKAANPIKKILQCASA